MPNCYDSKYSTVLLSVTTVDGLMSMFDKVRAVAGGRNASHVCNLAGGKIEAVACFLGGNCPSSMFVVGLGRGPVHLISSSGRRQERMAFMRCGGEKKYRRLHASRWEIADLIGRAKGQGRFGEPG